MTIVLAFGWASHFCFGAPLARLEGQIVIGGMPHHCPEMQLELTPLRWAHQLRFAWTYCSSAHDKAFIENSGLIFRENALVLRAAKSASVQCVQDIPCRAQGIPREADRHRL
jgi:hypothetical protein